jgi:hypothetical protein
VLKTLCSRSVALADLCTLVPNWVLAQGEGGFRVDVVNARSVTIDVNNIPILAQNLQPISYFTTRARSIKSNR